MTRQELSTTSSLSSLASRTNTAPSVSSYSTAGTTPNSYKRPIACRGETWPKTATRHLDDHICPIKPYNESRDTFEQFPSIVSSLAVDLNGDFTGLSCHAELEPERYSCDAIPSTSDDFQELWPSARTLHIHHDESSSDGNMNLRVDVQCTRRSGRQQKMILYHLRLKDLRTRSCTLRRYCRSGRDICRSSRKLLSQPARPGLTRSLSSFLTKSLKSQAAETTARPRSISLQKAGRLSLFSSSTSSSTDEDGYVHPLHLPMTIPGLSELSDTISLDFLNYQKIELQRLARRNKALYHFDHWGRPYSWTLADDAAGQQTGFVLRRRTDYSVLARLIPDHIPQDQARQNGITGGWIPPCQLVLAPGIDVCSDDLGDIIVSTALLAIVDHCIRLKFPEREARPSTSTAMRPLRWIDEVVGKISRPTTAI